MTIIRDPQRFEWQASGTQMSRVPYQAQVGTTIRVGTLAPGRRPGPLGAGAAWTRWSRDPRLRLSQHAQAAYYQEVSVLLNPHALVEQWGVQIQVRQASDEHLDILDHTLALVPGEHLAAVAQDKPEGIGLTAFVAQISNPNFTGGLNAGVDLPYTSWDDRLAILITYSSLWAAVQTRVCTSVFHEFGHVMARHGLSIAGTDPELWDEIRGIHVSTNPGARESLNDAYMHLLAAGSSHPAVRRHARDEANLLSSQRMRRALLACPAFSGLPAEWRARWE